MDRKALLVNPTEFFREKVNTASDHLQVKLDADIEFYLVNLLCHFIQPERLFNHQDDSFNQPMVMMLQRAYEAESLEQKLAILKQIGDTSLYVAGYFQGLF